VETG